MKIKKVYLGQRQIYPDNYDHFYADLTTQTEQQLNEKWWYIFGKTSSPNLSSSWLIWSGSSLNNRAWCIHKLSHKLTENSIIKAHITWYVWSTSTYWWINAVWLSDNQWVDGTWTTTPDNYYYKLEWKVTWWSLDQNKKVTLVENRWGLQTLLSISWYSTGNTELELIINLWEKNISYKQTSPSVLTGTCNLTDSQINNIINHMEYVYTDVVAFASWFTNYAKTIDVEIKY